MKKRTKNKGINLNITTQLTIGFIVIDLVAMLTLFVGYRSVATIVTVDDPQAYLARFSYQTMVLFLIILICTGGVSVTIINLIKKALNEINNASAELALGKTNITLNKLGNNEFGVIINDIQQIIDNIDEQAQIAKEAAEGNMTVTIETKSDEDTLGIALNMMIGNTKNTLRQIKEAANQVSAGANQVSKASDLLAGGTTEQAAAIQEITASISDVADKTVTNATQATEAEALILNALEKVTKGNSEMQEMVVAMEEINKSSESIYKIIKVIDDIAFQTNILALNAAVEAARAGVAGKGFAIVAEEVRNLAAKCAEAASSTTDMIEDSIHKISVGAKAAKETSYALCEISQVVEQSQALIVDISQASQNQKNAIFQIEQAIEQVTDVVQTNSSTSEECAAASAELMKQAQKVNRLISNFKLN